MASDALDKLRAAGFDPDKLPEEQRQVLADLSPEEAEVLLRIRERMHAAGPDVQGYVAAVDKGDVGVLYY